MKLGVVFPQTEIGDDPDRVAVFATTAESLGYDHIIAYDHVLGAGTENRPDWQGPYTDKSMFHEVFVLYGFLAGLTETLELVTAVVILPQRQTALVAKQAASLDVISKGRFRLGIGTGWNPVEYEALNQDFTNRGRRSEEQIDVLRKLFAQDVISYDGKWHKITEAGLNPLPVNKHIPIWLGGMAPQVMNRVARLADGWFPFFNKELEDQLASVRKMAKENDRDPADIGIEVMVGLGEASAKQLDQLKKLQDMGVTHSAVVTMNVGLSADEHVDAIKRFWDVAHSITD
ncbi:MAG: LLM class F420-dependent oxidoreductase [Gammaproteobacteria bacterium]|nr:LLM class F420-dependent oxidoreductase [Gammaproteobacteria bacterium]